MKKIILATLIATGIYADTSLSDDMCEAIGYSKYSCPLTIVESAIKYGVKKIEKDGGYAINFIEADAYSNDEKFYAVKAKMLERLSETEGLFYIDDKMVILDNLPEDVRFVPEFWYEGFIEGEGEYKKTISDYEYTMIPKGKVISIRHAKN